MIKIKDLKVKIQDKEILSGVNLDFEIGKNYCLLGKNGSGKSTLSSVLAGSPKYEVVGGSIEINGKNLFLLSPEERSGEGIFLSFQNVPEIHGIRLSEYLRTIYNIHIKNINLDVKPLSPFLFKRFVKKYLDELGIKEEFLDRDLNVGFSGGEKRKIEILQMKLINPKYIILDEIDSGLDLDAFKTVASLLKSLNSKDNCIIIITHYFKILDYIDVDKVYVMKDGIVEREGGNDLVKEVMEKGFE
nr:Fe-S cluster assembly ATPase SufC [Candidatus Gracilibacteria bacterium]